MAVWLPRGEDVASSLSLILHYSLLSSHHNHNSTDRQYHDYRKDGWIRVHPMGIPSNDFRWDDPSILLRILAYQELVWVGGADRGWSRKEGITVGRRRNQPEQRDGIPTWNSDHDEGCQHKFKKELCRQQKTCESHHLTLAQPIAALEAKQGIRWQSSSQFNRKQAL